MHHARHFVFNLCSSFLCDSWYKDQELLEYSYPGYLALNEDHMSIIANAINEGTYTCIVRKKERILTTYSWRIRLKH